MWIFFFPTKSFQSEASFYSYCFWVGKLSLSLSLSPRSSLSLGLYKFVLAKMYFVSFIFSIYEHILFSVILQFLPFPHYIYPSYGPSSISVCKSPSYLWTVQSFSVSYSYSVFFFLLPLLFWLFLAPLSYSSFPFGSLTRRRNVVSNPMWIFASFIGLCSLGLLICSLMEDFKCLQWFMPMVQDCKRESPCHFCNCCMWNAKCKRDCFAQFWSVWRK